MNTMYISMIVTLVKGFIKNPNKSAAVDKILVELRDALLIVYPVN